MLALRNTRAVSTKPTLVQHRIFVASSRPVAGGHIQYARFSNKTPVRTATYPRQAAAAAPAAGYQSITATTPPANPQFQQKNVLAKLPTPALLRNLLIQNISAIPPVLSFFLFFLKRYSNFITKAPVLRQALYYFFYVHYCAGATKSEIARTVEDLRKLGYKGVILNYAKEVEMPGLSVKSGAEQAAQAQALHEQQVGQWLDGTVKGIAYAPAGDYVAIKFSGAGTRVVEMLEKNNVKPDEVFADALDKVCEAAHQKGVKILVDAEHQCQQAAIDRWTMDMMEKYNKGDNVVIFNTYQMYLKASPSILAQHLATAESRNFNFGAKIVRGAYLGSDPRNAIHDTKADTDAAFDAAAEKLATYHTASPRPSIKVSTVIGSHNATSIRKIRALRQQQASAGQPVADVVFSQLMGMADELSLSLTEADPEAGFVQGDCGVYKYVTWGTMQECIMYLARRAEENRDAVACARDSRALFWNELKRRWGPAAKRA
ncbi:FAD-linked oxidoreductase-like protein [Phyllosticta citriasiana]|uniref:Proline dehydrogenase n=1 Tax=Phyllosticta citriasiana TaxID=595635 RepID=A0ABR1KGR0_9PEZI